MKSRLHIIHEQKINNIRRCQNNTPLTKHQVTIKAKFKKWYRNKNHVTLNVKLAELKHELKVTLIPNKILIVIQNIMDLWATKVNLFTNNTSIKTNTINYITGIPQGDSLSLMLFLWSVNPLSFLLSLLLGYNITKTNNKKQKLTHLFFVDDLKIFARN